MKIILIKYPNKPNDIMKISIERKTQWPQSCQYVKVYLAKWHMFIQFLEQWYKSLWLTYHL